MQFVHTDSDDRAFSTQKPAPNVSNWLWSGSIIAHRVVCEVSQSRTEVVQAGEHSNTIHT